MIVTRRLGAVALALGAAAPFAGSPYRAARGRIDIDETARAIEAGEDHVTATQLATWIRNRKPGLRVIDVRSPAEFAAYALPAAENVPLAAIPRASFPGAQTIVLYSEGGAHAAQAWMMLRAMGVTGAYFIAGGLTDWQDEVMAPVLPADASPQAAQAFEKTADLSRYFGGEPQIGGAATALPAAPSGQPAGAGAQLAARRRRGC